MLYAGNCHNNISQLFIHFTLIRKVKMPIFDNKCRKKEEIPDSQIPERHQKTPKNIIPPPCMHESYYIAFYIQSIVKYLCTDYVSKSIIWKWILPLHWVRHWTLMMKIHDFFILLKFLTKMEDFLTYSFLLVVDRTRALSVSSFRCNKKFLLHLNELRGPFLKKDH